MGLKIKSTTILGVRHKGVIAMGGDGQVTFGDMALKQKAVKVRKFKIEKGEILGGFAGIALFDPLLFLYILGPMLGLGFIEYLLTRRQRKKEQ